VAGAQPLRPSRPLGTYQVTSPSKPTLPAFTVVGTLVMIAPPLINGAPGCAQFHDGKGKAADKLVPKIDDHE
jgi:hypothetical protein